MIYLLYIFFIPILLFSTELITPIPLTSDINIKKANLGKELFFEKRLSQTNTISCSSCHDIPNGGDDGRKFSLGVNNKIGNINSPTVLNTRYNFVQFWDGRSSDLKDQISGPIHNPIEMNSNFPEIIKKLESQPFYINQFAKVYKSGITEENIKDAIVEFEKSLTTPNSKFDKYLRGDENALSENEKTGYELFKSYGCISCHNGTNLGGNLYQKIGIISPYYKEETNNLGRYNITKKDDDKFYFKVPTLRNIELTAPYLHDGSIKELNIVIRLMLKYQVGAIYEEKDIKYIEDFLKTLSGEIPKI